MGIRVESSMSVVCIRTLLSFTRTRVLTSSPITSATLQPCVIPAHAMLTNSISSSFVSRGLVSQNVKIKQEEVATLEKLDSLIENVHKENDFPDITKSETKIIIQEPDPSCLGNIRNQRPVVLLFGWGGASHKNLSKYSSIYLGAGFTTVQYILPTRHILNRPVYVHCFSDTGVMCYQGLDTANRRSNKMKRLNIRG